MAQLGPGSLIGGTFRIEGIVAKTPSATIYSCKASGGERRFVKVLMAMLAADREDRGRFEREFQVLSRIRHPAVASVFEMDTGADDVPFIVMESLEGETLKDRLRRGPIDPRQAVVITLQLLDALRAAHAEGVIHRDLEPANVYILDRPDRDFALKIFNFAFARTDDAVRPGERLTQPGTVLGNPEYMAPEQARGDKVDGRTDIYSMGCLAYALVTGQPPFSGRSGAVIARQIEEEPQPARQRNPETPTWFDKWIQRALKKSPRERFADATEAREILAWAVESGVVVANTQLIPPRVAGRDFARWAAEPRRGAAAPRAAAEPARAVAAPRPEMADTLLAAPPVVAQEPAPPPVVSRAPDTAATVVDEPAAAPVPLPGARRPAQFASVDWMASPDDASAADDFDDPPPERGSSKKLALGVTIVVALGAAAMLLAFE